MTYTRSSDFVTAGDSRRSAKMNAELDLIAAESASVEAALALKAPLASPVLTGVPTAPTAAEATNTTQIATTAFVTNEIAAAAAISLPNVATHGPNSPLVTDGTNLAWDDDVKIPYTLPLIGTNSGYTAMATIDQIDTTANDTGLGTTGLTVVFGSSLFVASGRSAAGNVATSTDGSTWTLRAMSASKTWRLGTDGTNFMAVADNDTTINISTNGTSWSAATAIAAACASNPAVIGTTWLIVSNTAATGYTSTNHGTSWSTQTLPTGTGYDLLFVIDGLFVSCKNGQTAYYTSATGLTGSWTTRTAPGAAPLFLKNPDGTIACCDLDTGDQVYECSDGITWTAVSQLRHLTSTGTPFMKMNGTWVAFSTTFGAGGSYKGGTTILRHSATQITLTATAHSMATTNGSGLFVAGSSTDANVVTLSTTGSPTALFRVT